MSELIFDIGMHDGTDTSFYMNKGFRVVSVEANPSLVRNARSRFAAQVSRGDLFVLNEALSIRAGELTEFYLIPDRDDLGTTKLERAALWQHTKITLVTTSLSDLVRRFGTPYYIKIDIEGHDADCLADLAHMPQVPKYISAEANVDELSNCRLMLEALTSAGYGRFKVLNQAMN